MKETDWQVFWANIFYSLLAVACIVLLCLVTKAFQADHKVRYYYLISYTPTGTSIPKIVADIDWQCDETIVLDRNITYSQAIQMVDSLNNTLK